MSSRTRSHLERRNRKGQRGFTLLEQAVAIGSLLMVIAGAVDVGRVLHAYQALQAGVKTALRECYVVDGKCVEPGAQTSSQLSKVWQKPIKGFEHDYSGNGWYLRLPSISYAPSAKVLGSYQASYPEERGHLWLNRYNRTARFAWGRQESPLPTIEALEDKTDIAKLEGGARVPLAEYCSFEGMTEKTHRVARIWDAGTAVGDISSELLKVHGYTKETSRTMVLRARCTIPSPFANRSSDDKAHANVCKLKNAGRDCPATWKERTDIAVVVTGTPGEGLEGDGKLGISVSQESNEEIRREAPDKDCTTCDCTTKGGITTCQYGGRDFRKGMSKINLIPRGLHDENIRVCDAKKENAPCLAKPLPDELKFHDSISVLYDKEFDILLTIKAKDDKKAVAWNLGTFALYYVPYRVTVEQVPCKGTVRKSEEDSRCEVAQEVKAEKNLQGKPYGVKLGEVVKREEVDGVSSCSLPLLSAQKPNKEAYCTAAQDLKNCSDYDFTITSSDCPVYTDKEISCPRNYGVSPLTEGKKEGERAYYERSAEAAGVCPAMRSQEMDPNVSPIVERWYDKEMALPSVAFEKARCRQLAGEKQAFPAEHQQYKNWRTGSYTLVGSGTEDLGSATDPRLEKEKNPDYRCSEVTAESIAYKASNVIDGGCGTQACAVLTSRGGLPATQFCEFTSRVRSLVQTTERYYENAGQLDSCTDYMVLNQRGKYHGLFTETFPSVCTPIDPTDPERKRRSAASEWCLFDSEGIVTTGSSVSYTQGSAESGVRAVQSFLPSAKIDCSPDSPGYCLTFPRPGRIGEVGSLVEAKASLTVPVTLLSPFQKRLTLSYSDRRVWEGEFAR